MADTWAGSLHVTPTLHTFLLLGAHLFGFGGLWIVQFIFLDRVLFGRELGPVRDRASALVLFEGK